MEGRSEVRGTQNPKADRQYASSLSFLPIFNFYLEIEREEKKVTQSIKTMAKKDPGSAKIVGDWFYQCTMEKFALAQLIIKIKLWYNTRY